MSRNRTPKAMEAQLHVGGLLDGEREAQEDRRDDEGGVLSLLLASPYELASQARLS